MSDRRQRPVTDHVVEQDTFSANGQMIRSDTYHYTVHWVFDKAGNLLHAYATGVVIRMRLPDGTLFNAAGRVDILASNEAFSITPDTGHIHLSMDGTLISMSGDTLQVIDLRNVTPGEHTLTADFVAADHLPFNPPVTSSVTFERASG